MKHIKIIYFEGCPEAKNVRAALLNAGVYDFEVIIQNKLSKEHKYRNFSSPSLLIGEELIYGTKVNGGMGSCTFSPGDLARSIQSIKTSEVSSVSIKAKELRSFFSPSLTALLALKCPACIPALTAILSTLGLGFLLSQVIIKSIFIIFLLITITSLFFTYKNKHRSLLPVIGAVIFSSILYIGRFHYANQFILYTGMAGLFAMVIIDLSLKNKSSCLACS